MQLFYISDLESDIQELTQEESNHCIRVLRMTEKDELFLTDGKGMLCKAKIISPNNKQCIVQIVERIYDYEKRDHYLHIAVAPTKNMARWEWFLEKAVEVGIDEITPILCEHSERISLKTDRLEKIVIAAMKQSLKTYKPQLNAPIAFMDFLAHPFNGQKYIAYCDGKERKGLKSTYERHLPTLMLIGPEGDFSTEEITAALSNKFEPVTLGNYRLRTETAALATCFFINFMNED